MMSRRLTLLICYALFLPLAACSSTVRKPRLLHPGPAGYQQANAEQYDPYPQNDVGPEIVGGRPLDFQIPPDEVVRARQQQPVGPWRATAPIGSPIAVPIAPPVAAPITPPFTMPSHAPRY
jgi:hypothetical protein